MRLAFSKAFKIKTKQKQYKLITMKKIFAIISVLCLLATSAIAQHTSPRFGTAPNQDQTYRNLTQAVVAIADVASATKDTIFILPNAYKTHYVLTLSDSVVIAFKSVGSSYFADNITFTIANTAGANHFVEFLGSSRYYSGASKWGMISTGTKISPAASLSATLQFYFDGVLWNEESRAIR